MTSGLRKLALAGLAVVVLGASGAMCQRVAHRGRYAAPYSTYGAGPDGTRALYLLAEQHGAGAARWAADLGGLPTGGVLVALGGCEAGLRRPLSVFEERALRDWVEGGGVLVVAGVEGYLPDGFGVRIERVSGQCDRGFWAWLAKGSLDPDENEEEKEAGEAAEDGARAEPPAPQAFGPNAVGDEEEIGDDLPPMHWAEVTSPVLEGLAAVPMRRPARIFVEKEVEAEHLLALEGESVAVAVRRGAGRVVALSSASPLQNRELGASDGGAFFVRLLDAYGPGRAVRFDEYHLGVGSTRSILQYTRQIGGGAVALQLLVLLAFALFRHGVRFGAPLHPEPTLPGGTASYARALGALYRKTGDRASTLALVADGAYRRIAAHHHVPLAGPEALATSLAPRSEEAASAVRSIADLVAGGPVGEPGLLSRAQQIDALVATVITERKRTA